LKKILFSRPVFLLVTVSMVLGAFFRQELYAFLLSPDGLSLAKSEICVLNDSDLEPIVTIDVAKGATNIKLLFIGEEICSPSPENESLGTIRVSLEDGAGPFCEIEAASNKKYVLLSYDGKQQCKWGSK